jgi:hypothetical protein
MLSFMAVFHVWERTSGSGEVRLRALASRAKYISPTMGPGGRPVSKAWARILVLRVTGMGVVKTGEGVRKTVRMPVAAAVTSTIGDRVGEVERRNVVAERMTT